MPIYEYFCLDCEHKFELLRPMSKAEESGVCPKCGGAAPRVPSKFCRSSDETSTDASACGTCATDSCNTCSL
ncbi:MAG: zinc ribbon domain-containing protein [Dehalococcoidia bacterium]|nr:MAG: zinc ribbon domain-containing protein [Dehalococcoidia bacterium]